jgi:hypothetical protein
MPQGDREAIGSVLGELKIHPLESGESAISAFVLIKTRDGEGNSTWSYRTTEAPNREELLGALQVQVDLLRRELLNDWESE